MGLIKTNMGDYELRVLDGGFELLAGKLNVQKMLEFTWRWRRGTVVRGASLSFGGVSRALCPSVLRRGIVTASSKRFHASPASNRTCRVDGPFGPGAIHRS